MKNMREALIEAFEKASEAHAMAFIQVDGEDPDWALWYAGFLQQPLSGILGRNLSRAEIVTCLISVEEERLARFGKTYPWPPMYADHFIERLSLPDPLNETGLALYYYPQCPFCQRVLHAIRETGAKVELRHVWDNPDYYEELLEARGRATVPVLRITTKGKDRWMPESADIVRYLRERVAAR